MNGLRVVFLKEIQKGASVDRFANVVIHAGFKAPLPVAAHRVRRHRDDGYMTGSRAARVPEWLWRASNPSISGI